MQDIVTWAAPIATTIAALMTASNLGSRVTGWGFGVFLVGSVLWTTLGVLTGQSNLVVQNVVLSLLNLFGMWRWLGRQARIDEGEEAAQRQSAQSAGESLFPVAALSSAKLRRPSGETIGGAVGAMAGCRSGRIAYLVVGEGGVAGVGERLHRLDWDEVRVEGNELVTRRSSLEGLEEVEVDNWPAR